MNQEVLVSITLTKNEALFLDDSMTMLVESDSGIRPLNAMCLNPSIELSKLPVGQDMLVKIGSAILDTEDSLEATIQLDMLELWLLREICQSNREYDGENVGLSLKTKIYKAIGKGNQEIEENEERVHSFESMMSFLPPDAI